MTIIRVKHDKYNPYMTVKKDILYNNEISAEAKTIYFYAFSRPDDWQFYRDEIGKHMKEGRDQISRALQELQDYGYLKKTPNQDPETGQMQGWSWEFYETPQEGEGIKIFSPKDWNRVSREFRQSENKTLLNKERELNKEKTTTEQVVVVPSNSPLNDLDLSMDTMERLYEKHPEKIHKLVERVKRWEGRDNDRRAINVILERWDSWDDNPTKNEVIDANRAALSVLRKYEGQTPISDHCDVRIVVLNSHVEFVCGTAVDIVKLDEKDFKEKVNALFAKYKINKK